MTEQHPEHGSEPGSEPDSEPDSAYGSEQVPPPPAYQPYPEDASHREAESFAQATREQQPMSIKRAVLLMRIGAAVAALGLVFTFLSLGQLKDNIREQIATSSTLDPSDYDALLRASIVFSIFTAVLGVSLWLWMAWANGRGRRWARIVATILGAINVISFLYVIGGGNLTTLALVASTINVIVGVGALVFLYRPDANAYFAAHARR